MHEWRRSIFMELSACFKQTVPHGAQDFARGIPLPQHHAYPHCRCDDPCNAHLLDDGSGFRVAKDDLNAAVAYGSTGKEVRLDDFRG